MLCLAPVSQCCLFRYSTLVKLWNFYQGPRRLSDLMRDSMATDPVAPILLERHLRALDRRVKIILKTVYECVQKKGADNVMIMDGF
jgi:DNA-binding HxlR family transcriptional regulator